MPRWSIVPPPLSNVLQYRPLFSNLAYRLSNAARPGLWMGSSLGTGAGPATGAGVGECLIGILASVFGSPILVTRRAALIGLITSTPEES